MQAKGSERVSNARLAGPRATAAWLVARGFYAMPAWRVCVSLDATERAPGPTNETRFQLAIAANEWSFRFSRGSRGSSIRVAAAPTIDERDDFGLLARVPPLNNLGVLVEGLETRFGLKFHRQRAEIETSIPKSEQKILLWVVSSL